MLANKKISIIVPIYNGEKYIIGLLENITEFIKNLSENNIDSQVIMILDSCIDGTEQLINKHKYNLDIVLLKNSEKKGPSYCRNKGIKNANGDYLLFLDVDDSLIIHGFENLYSDINFDNDIIIGNYYIKNKSEFQLRDHGMQSKVERLEVPKPRILEYLSKYCLEPYRYTLLVHCWCKLYKTTYIKKNNLKFKENIDQLEDVNFNLNCLKFSPKVMYINRAIYCYTKNSGESNLSKMSGGRVMNISGVVRALYAIKNILKDDASCCNKGYRYHLYATTFVLWLLRASRESNNFLLIYKLFLSYCSKNYVRLSMKYYVKLASNDHLIPVLLRYNIPSIALTYCKFKK